MTSSAQHKRRLIDNCEPRIRHVYTGLIHLPIKITIEISKEAIKSEFFDNCGKVIRDKDDGSIADVEISWTPRSLMSTCKELHFN